MKTTYRVMSDVALIQECSTGSEAAWNELFSRYHRGLLRTVRRLLVLMARQDPTSARRILENMIAQAPTAIYPQDIHSHLPAPGGQGALIQECSTGSEAAWNELFSRYHRGLLRTVRRLLVLMARQDPTSARRILENMIAQAPTAIYPRVIHSHLPAPRRART
jgi:3-polyprenyl-4-hydroxybenzoate decarboxylase